MTAFVDLKRGDFGVELVCRTLGVSASAYYRRKTGKPSARAVEDVRLGVKIREVFNANYECYGYRRMYHAMLREREQIGRDHVARLMRASGLRGAKRRGTPWRTTVPAVGRELQPDLVHREFVAHAPNRLWVGDFVRHEALFDRMEVEDHHRLAVAAAGLKLRAA